MMQTDTQVSLVSGCRGLLAEGCRSGSYSWAVVETGYRRASQTPWSARESEVGDWSLEGRLWLPSGRV